MRTTLTVYKASTYVRLTGYKPELEKQILRPFCRRNFFRVQKVPGGPFGAPPEWKVSHVFARFNNDKTELRFNLSKLEDLLSMMEQQGYKRSRVEILEEKKIPAKKVMIPWKDEKIQPRNEVQEEFTEFMSGPAALTTNNMGTGQGKFGPLSGRVKIPGGWTTMGQIKKGDIVTAWDGTPTKVLEIYPQGVKDIYEFTFSDGRKAEAGLEHLWKVFDGTWSIKTTKEIMSGMPEVMYSIPLLKPEVVEDVILPMHPWSYGFSLDGDEYISNVYMDSSPDQKRLLVLGMMAGSDPEGIDDYYLAKTEKVAKQFQELVWSIGGWCQVIPGYHGFECYFDLTKETLEITKVELVRQEEAQCISVEHPDHLYVCDDYVVTHNTFCALYSAWKLGERILITVLPRYVDIWLKAFGEFYKLEKGDVVIADLISVEQLHEAVVSNKIDPKIIIIPLSKIDIHLKKMRDVEGTLDLDKIFEDLQCGTRIIDEAHESIYSVYCSLMHGNHNKTMVLSATLKGDDEFINGIYSQIFPMSSYLRPTEYTKYIHVVAYVHRMDLWKYKINTKGFGGYSHVKFEQGILKNKGLFEHYYQMLKSAYDTYYMDEYRENQKSMWFFATIEFCEEFNKRLLKDYPDLDSIVFTSVLSKKEPTAYREHRNVVTTPGSCGTGKDIPYLKAVFSPIAVSSTQRNDQMVGRTRPIDKWWPDLDPIFVYFVCLDEKKQVEYHRKRRGLFDRKCKKFELIDSGSRIM